MVLLYLCQDMNFFIHERKKEVLIAAIQAYPCLYDSTEESYHNKFSKNNQKSTFKLAVQVKVGKHMHSSVLCKDGYFKIVWYSMIALYHIF